MYFPVAHKFGVKTIIHSHSTSNGTGLKAIVKKVLQYPLRRMSDYFFGCSVKSGIWLFGKNATDGDRYYTLPNSIDTSRFKFDPNIRDAVRKELDLGDKKTFIHVGRLHEAKNHGFLLELFAEINKKDENTILLCLGDGDLLGDIRKKIDTLGISESVKMLGSRPDVERYLMAADAFLFPSLWEGVPVTVVEAQAAGLPCFVSDRITDDVCLSKLVEKITIDYGVEPWLNKIHSACYNREDVIDAIIDGGYDVKNNAVWLEDFYSKIIS